jgi:hypothetical protein
VRRRRGNKTRRQESRRPYDRQEARRERRGTGTGTGRVRGEAYDLWVLRDDLLLGKEILEAIQRNLYIYIYIYMQNTPPRFECAFPYVCPEPVLVK